MPCFMLIFSSLYSSPGMGLSAKEGNERKMPFCRKAVRTVTGHFVECTGSGNRMLSWKVMRMGTAKVAGGQGPS